MERLDSLASRLDALPERELRSGRRLTASDREAMEAIVDQRMEAMARIIESRLAATLVEPALKRFEQRLNSVLSALGAASAEQSFDPTVTQGDNISGNVVMLSTGQNIPQRSEDDGDLWDAIRALPRLSA